MRHYAAKLKLFNFDALRRTRTIDAMDNMAGPSIDREQLIEAVRKFPCLYDTTKKEYKDDLIRENAWKAICMEMYGKEYDDMEKLAIGKTTLVISCI